MTADRVTAALSGLLSPGREDEAARRAYEQAVVGFFGTGSAYAFWKGRVALYAILRALRIGEGDEVILPGYTCVMVAGPVLYVGASPVYVDIDPDSYNTLPSEIERHLSPRTRAIIVQHTYGIPARVTDIVRLAQAHGIPVIEDCCHTFGGRLNGRLLGTFGAAAFFSGQWNKSFSTGLGGLALVQEPHLAEAVGCEQAAYPLPSRKTAMMLAAQILAHELLIRPSTAAKATLIFRWLTEKGLVVGSSSKVDFEPTLPRDYALRPSAVQCRVGLGEVKRLAGNVSRRQWAATHYLRELPLLGYRLPVAPEGSEAMLVRFPLRVSNKAEALAQAPGSGVEIGSWFERALHPEGTDHEAFRYHPGECPNAETAAAQVINLPTHPRVTERDLEKTLAFVQRVCRPVEPR